VSGLYGRKGGAALSWGSAERLLRRIVIPNPLAGAECASARPRPLRRCRKRVLSSQAVHSPTCLALRGEGRDVSS
jgi:hypothetical protein